MLGDLATKENQVKLSEGLASIKAALVRQFDVKFEGQTLEEARLDKPEDIPAMARLMAAFELTPFEAWVLLLSAAPELDSSFIKVFNGLSATSHPSFGLALAAFKVAHWSALAPSSALRYWQLIQLEGKSLTQAPLRIDERVLHYMLGINERSAELQSVCEVIEPIASCGSWSREIEQVSRLFEQALQLIHLPAHSARGFAEGLCTSMAWGLLVLKTSNLPTALSERSAFLRLFEKEFRLKPFCLLVPNRLVNESWIAELQVPRLVEGSSTLTGLSLSLSPRSHEVQKQIWVQALGLNKPALDQDGLELLCQYRFNHAEAKKCVQDALTTNNFSQGLSRICQDVATAPLRGLAQRVETTTHDDLVLPEIQQQKIDDLLRHIKGHLRLPEQVRQKGVNALFAGPSGTGKTLAAAITARALGLALFKVDLSQVVNKYIGETEKNLDRVFLAAEASTAVLLFDEADALFGKRSDVKDSHDRYANQEISYLLQRIEAYNGIAILTTNLQGSIDTAFIRRFQFIISFPFPADEQRRHLWRTMLERYQAGPVNFDSLIPLHLSGANIKSAVYHAACLAAAQESVITLEHIQKGVELEYDKLGKGAISWTVNQ